MSQRIVIDPVTRIEGHARVSIQLDDAGQVEEARLHVTELRGFERFCVGRSFREMPAITSRICGICPVSHQLASAQATDDLLAVRVPAPARLLRQLVNLAQLVQSHALSFFYLSSPDWALGYDADPATRSVLGLAAARPELARRGIRLRAWGQDVIATVAGKRIHPGWAVPGGVAAPLTVAGLEHLQAGLPGALDAARRTLDEFRAALEAHREEARVFGNFPSLFLALVGPEGVLAHTSGKLRFVDEEGRVLADQVEPERYQDLIGEAVEPWSYLKFPYYKPLGYPAGMYRVGPLARLNACSRAGTPLADAELVEFRKLGRGAVLSSFHAHYARLIEILYGLERIGQLLDDPELLSDDVRAVAFRNRFRGVGACEAPRGTLFHDYQVERGGTLTRVNLLVATGQNNLAMNRTVTQIARHVLSGRRVEEGLLNRIEAGIRAYDPCLSCSTHAAGRMPLVVELRDPRGELLDSAAR